MEKRQAAGHVDSIIATEIQNRWGHFPPHKIMPGQVEKFVSDLRDTYAPSSVYLHRHTLKTILTFVDRTHRTYLAEMVPRVPPAPQRHVIATEDEVKSLLVHATTWQRAMILFARGMAMIGLIVSLVMRMVRMVVSMRV